MVHKKFSNSFGPAYGEDDRTDFLYDREEYEALKRLVDGIDITIYRDGSAAKDGNLDVLIRKAETPEGVKYAAEMIPVHGAISHVETPWNKSAQRNYKTFSYPNRFDVGIMNEENIVQVLSIWYSQEGYMKTNPEARLNAEDTIREHTPQKPIEFKLEKGKTIIISPDAVQVVE